MIAVDPEPGPPTLVSVVAPMYNEGAAIEEFVRRVAQACGRLQDRYRFEFVLVDDGSRDESLKIATTLIAKEPRLRVIELRRNFGQTAALQAGLAHARGDIVISMDSDLQHFPEDIPQFLEQIEAGFDLVCGWRHDRQEGIVRRWPSRVANRIIRRVSGLRVHDIGTTFRAYRQDLIQHMLLLGEQHRFVPALASMVGARITEVRIKNVERPSGASNYGLSRTFNVLLDILFLYFASRYLTRPLKAFGKIAMLLGVSGFAIAVGLLIYGWSMGVPGVVRAHSGWVLFAILLELAALQIFMTGILAEILVRIYYSRTGDQGYVVRREWSARQEIV